MALPDEYVGWRKSSRSKDTPECVEVAASVRAGEGVGVRDTKQHGRGPVLAISADAWRQFAREIKEGCHDLL